MLQVIIEIIDMKNTRSKFVRKLSMDFKNKK